MPFYTDFFLLVFLLVLLPFSAKSQLHSVHCGSSKYGKMLACHHDQLYQIPILMIIVASL